MIHTPEPVRRVVEQNVRMYDALRENGFAAELIRNPNGEALAVVSRRMCDPMQLMGSAALTAAIEAGQYDSYFELGDVLPLSGRRIYPASFLAVLDLVA